MKTTRQAISKEMNKLNSYEEEAFYRLLRYYTTNHKAKYPKWVNDLSEGVELVKAEVDSVGKLETASLAEAMETSYLGVSSCVIANMALFYQKRKEKELRQP